MSDTPDSINTFKDNDLKAQIESAMDRPVTPEEIAYLLSRMPFLQITSLDMALDDLTPPTFITAKTGWIIHDYTFALCSSPGKLLWGNPDDDGDSGAGELTRQGTIINQAQLTATEMIAIATERGWPAVNIIDGNPLMKFVAWDACQTNGIKSIGFEPTDSDLKKQKRLHREQREIESIRARRSKNHRP